MTDEEKLAALLKEAEQWAGGPAEVVDTPFDVIMFDRVLTEEERKIVGDYLLKKGRRQ